jgi:hypothetical protein
MSTPMTVMLPPDLGKVAFGLQGSGSLGADQVAAGLPIGCMFCPHQRVLRVGGGENPSIPRRFGGLSARHRLHGNSP